MSKLQAKITVSCVVINYNSERLLGSCLLSLLGLDFPDKEIIFIDNASSDGSVPFMLRNYPHVRTIANKENSGYAGGANQAIEMSSGEFVMILNPDIVFEPDYLKHLVWRLQENKEIGAIIGKLRKYDFARDPSRGAKTNLIDSAGLLMYRNRRCVDRGQGEVDSGQYDTAEEVFGITGACPLYRRAALEDCKIGVDSAARGHGNTAAGEYFDNNFFMYKEDVDISWRMRLFGWQCFYEPAAVAYHGRGTGVVDRRALWSVVKERRNLSKFQKYYSYKNERLMRVKNELLGSVARDFLLILFKEILMFGWIILREPFLFKSLGRFFLQLPNALLKRLEIMKRKKVSGKEMARWFV